MPGAAWYAATDEQIAQAFQHVLALEASRHVDGQALASVLVDQGEQLKGESRFVIALPKPS